MPSDRDSPLAGRKILVVEDEYFLADDLRQALERLGGSVIGPVGHLAAAQKLAQEPQIDCALLDINLHKEQAFGVARALIARNIPCFFTTGYNPDAIPADLKKIRCLQKPLLMPDVIGAVLSATAQK